MVYQIVVKGRLDQSWSDWLGGARVTSVVDENSSMTTTLTVKVADQPALFGILDRIRDMNLLPISVARIDTEM
jgi:hypothetical protein